MKTRFLAYLFCATLAAFPAAAEPQKLATNGDWTVYTLEDNGATVCFMASKPVKTEGLSASAKRGDVFALITHRTDDPSPYVFSFQAGYTYQQQSEVNVQLDGQSYSLFTQDDTAWAKTAEVDAAIADAIRKGKSMKVVGTSSRGTTTTDTISLKGTGAAFKALAQACRVGN